MAVNAITADDTLTIFDRIISDFADGSNSTIAFNNDLIGAKTGKNGNTIYVRNETGHNAILTLRLIRGSADDRFLNQKLQQLEKDFPSFVLGEGEFVKRVGDGLGNVASDVYQLSGVCPQKKVDTQENVEGDTEQGAVVYTLFSSYTSRGIK